MKWLWINPWPEEAANPRGFVASGIAGNIRAGSCSDGGQRGRAAPGDKGQQAGMARGAKPPAGTLPQGRASAQPEPQRRRQIRAAEGAAPSLSTKQMPGFGNKSPPAGR